MKTHLIAGLICAAIAGSAAAQTFTAPATPRTEQQSRQRRAPELTREPVTGVIPRAVRGGNPLQMLNPAAPARYGTAEESVVIDPYTGKWRGIKFLTFNF